MQLRFSKKVIAALRKSEVLITATPESGEIIKKVHNIESIQINETGCYIKKDIEKVNKSNEYFDILWVGRFIYTKQLKLALNVIKEISHLKNIRFHIVGQGFQRRRNSTIQKLCNSFRNK